MGAFVLLNLFFNKPGSKIYSYCNIYFWGLNIDLYFFFKYDDAKNKKYCIRKKVLTSTVLILVTDIRAKNKKKLYISLVFTKEGYILFLTTNTSYIMR